MIGFMIGAALLSVGAMACVLVPLRRTAAGAPHVNAPTAWTLALSAPLLAVVLYAALGTSAAWELPVTDRHQEANRLLDLATSAAAAQGQRLDGDPARLIQQALALDPT